MFAYTPYDNCQFQPAFSGNLQIPDAFEQVVDLFRRREAEAQRQRQLVRPRIVKKVESEDSFQLQIFKEYGNFNSYEVQVVKKPGNKAHLIISSEEDEFQKIFEFSLEDIDVQKIDWEHYSAEKVLVLNIPKKQNAPEVVCYTHPFFNFIQQQQQQQQQQQHEVGSKKAREYRQRVEASKQRAQQRRAEKRAEAEQRRAIAEQERIEEENRKRAALEQQRVEEENKRRAFIELQQIEQRRQAEQRRLAQQAEQKKLAEQRRLAEEKRRADEQRRAEAKRQSAIEKQRQLEANKNSAPSQNIRLEAGNAEDFLQQLFGAMFAAQQQTNQQRQAEVQNSNSSSPVAEAPISPVVSTPEVLKPTSYESDTESIDSEHDIETPPPSSPSSTGSKITKQPSLEEVEDEEFILLKKKFGQ
ncbi:hypothetical protein CAAN3_01S08988 [[Candida] anglica]